MILIPILVIGVHILKWFWLAGYKLINIIFGADWLMGEKFHNIVGWATDLVNPGLTLCCDMKSCGNSAITLITFIQEGVVLSSI